MQIMLVMFADTGTNIVDNDDAVDADDADTDDADDADDAC